MERSLRSALGLSRRAERSGTSIADPGPFGWAAPGPGGWERVLDPLFYGVLFLLLFSCLLLIGRIPPGEPLGGPDELMHISVADYIGRNLEWPPWDSPELLRGPRGTGESTASAIVYWLHGLSFRAFGVHRVGSWLLFAGYLLCLLLVYQRQRLAGFLGLAFTTPQLVFLFSYVNSDVGTVVTAFVFGLACGAYIRHPDKPLSLYLFFVAAGACLTSRHHLWPLAFVLFAYGLWSTRRTLRTTPRKRLALALILAAIPALWWPITGLTANDGDPVGFQVSAQSVERFGTEIPAGTGPRPLADISWRSFLSANAVSFYASWGWLRSFLPSWAYYAAFALLLATFLLVAARFPALAAGGAVLVLLNIALLVLYSVALDYQAQGRYLFPSVFLFVGLLLARLTAEPVDGRTRWARAICVLAVATSLFNAGAVLALARSTYGVMLWPARPPIVLSEPLQALLRTATLSPDIRTLSLGGKPVLYCHAPCRSTLKMPPDAARVELEVGFLQGRGSEEERAAQESNGVRLILSGVGQGTERIPLGSHLLLPFEDARRSEPVEVSVDIPPGVEALEIYFDPIDGNISWDWTYIGGVSVLPSPLAG